MKLLPFSIQRMVFRDEPALKGVAFADRHPVQLVTIENFPKSEAPIPGYFVMSSAPPNIDEKSDEPNIDAQRQKIKTEHYNAALGIQEIAQHLYDIFKRGEEPELVITVHGYNTSRSSVRNWYKRIFLYINDYDSEIRSRRTQVFVGYRWPSEQIELRRLGEALKALPPLPRDLLSFGVVCGILMLALEFIPFEETLGGFLLGLPLAVFLLLGCLMLALVLMRLVVYFRDRYRANNFGVLDLVELLRQIDREMVRLKALDIQRQETNEDCPEDNCKDEAADFWQNQQRKVKLSFLGHSMGGFVATNAVRILSDVFDSRSIEQQPPADVGSVFKLERLLLASPDIPVLTIISSRSNFLASSLRRFAESYLFSSEGDIALRIASTAANYIAFPSRTQSRGYRLGNVALNQTSRTSRKNLQGIVNLTTLDQQFHLGRPLAEAIAHTPDKVLENLFVTSKRPGQRSGQQSGESLADLFRVQTKLNHERVTVADFFTFFDYTDYKDVTFTVETRKRTARPQGVLTRAKESNRLNSFDYFLLTLDYGLGRRDVHGGYFDGELSQQMVYRILFLGFTGYLKTMAPDPEVAFDPHAALSNLHFKCRDYGIQGFLSPIRYRVDIQEQPLADTIEELLTAIIEDSQE